MLWAKSQISGPLILSGIQNGSIAGVKTQHKLILSLNVA